MREGSWSASNETGPGGGTLLATRSGYRGQPRCVVLATRISACLSFSFSFPLCLDEYSDRRAQPVFTWVNITYEPRQWTPVTLLYSSVRILLNSFVLRDSIHVGIVCDYHAYLTSTNYPLSLRTKWIFLFDFVSCCYWKDECTVFFSFYFILFFYASFLVIFLAIFFDQKIEDWSNPVGGRGKPCGSEVYCAGSWMGLSRGERSGPRLRTRTRSPDSRALRYYTGADSVGRLSNRPGTLYPCPWTVST